MPEQFLRREPSVKFLPLERYFYILVSYDIKGARFYGPQFI